MYIYILCVLVCVGGGEGVSTVRVFACEAFVMLASADFCLS